MWDFFFLKSVLELCINIYLFTSIYICLHQYTFFSAFSCGPLRESYQVNRWYNFKKIKRKDSQFLNHGNLILVLRWLRHVFLQNFVLAIITPQLECILIPLTTKSEIGIGKKQETCSPTVITDYQDGFKNRNLMSSFEYSIISHHLTSVFYQYKLIHSWKVIFQKEDHLYFNRLCD